MSRRLLLGVGVLLLVSVAVVYTGTLLEARVFPGCSRSLDADSSTTQTGHASMRWVPPAVRCAYPTDDFWGVSPAQEAHFAFFGVALMGMFAAALTYFVALGRVPDR
ncbi:MAG TPA: hypothetical protein VGP92_19725 [Acidimicrobiia bacterium]|nr:hypothetical protein [Acidimicrobiia bacterium]